MIAREGGMSEGDAVTQHAGFGRVENQQFAVRADGERRRFAGGLAEFGSEIDVSFSRAVGGAGDV